jgi:hypothetical protein
MTWYRRYRRPSVASIMPHLLIIMNVLLIVCANEAFADGTAFGTTHWIATSAILASNGLWHVWAAVRVRVYSPGMVTGMLLYVPLAIYGCTHFLRSGSVRIGSAVTAVLIGGSYPWWPAVYHARNRSSA